jgi:hypothetical protein
MPIFIEVYLANMIALASSSIPARAIAAAALAWPMLRPISYNAFKKFFIDKIPFEN